jgi:hypothetical protein
LLRFGEASAFPLLCFGFGGADANAKEGRRSGSAKPKSEEAEKEKRRSEAKEAKQSEGSKAKVRRTDASFASSHAFASAKHVMKRRTANAKRRSESM